ncbi:MAG: SUMF1/EgtB/PvdO family nonheme iron enzyme [Candidatus Latescibacter sp.]|nr:SUMF1/EgtB/PvdO family nonheme iron enzyme [Candidatus Latescibacter sp.]
MAFRIPGFIRGIGGHYKIFLGIGIGICITFLGYGGIHYSSTDRFCFLCHAHPQSVISWKKSTHYKNKTGMVVHCAECHLPSGGVSYLTEKTRLGVRDVYSYYFKDVKKINWEAKSTLQHASTYTYDSSCLECHPDLYSLDLTPKGVKAHEYYMRTSDKIRCINCHLDVGHFREKPTEAMEVPTEGEKSKRPIYPPDTGKFENYSEIMSGSDVTFNMIAIPGGTFLMGSPDSEQGRRTDEGPPCRVKLSRFWMGEAEVSWREFDVYYSRTSTGKKTEGSQTASADSVRFDAVTGPTPPYGAPDQGWGKGSRPAFTMTWFAAAKYCEWLSEVTGRKYRLPTEAEWEYACRAGKPGAYSFPADMGKLSRKSLKNRLFGIDDSSVRKYAWFRSNSELETQPPYTNEPNPWGLYNMLGNVREFCLDWYSPDTYKENASESLMVNPRGPASGNDHVVRGGSYASSPEDLRSAARDRTDHDAWMVTDPQSPKSIWWYSDSKEVGLRVVREVEIDR